MTILFWGFPLARRQDTWCQNHLNADMKTAANRVLRCSEKSATSHIIYCLVQYMEYWIHGFPAGSSVKTSCIVIKQFSGDSGCFIETSCQQEEWLVFRHSHSLNCYMFYGLTPTGRSVLCPSTFDHQSPDSWSSASVLYRPPAQYTALALARLKEVYLDSVHVQR